jgi:hypothetical protein
MKHKPSGTILAALVVLCAASRVPALTAPDTSDYVLVAYKLTPAQESLFVRDAAMSPFWSAWDRANTGDSMRLDYVDLTVEKNAWVAGGAQFSGHGDAGEVIRAAYGEKGLYLYFGVTDDNWQQPADFETDVLDFLIDRRSSQEIRECNPFDCLPSGVWALWSSWPVYSSVQYQIQVGGLSVPQRVRLNYLEGSTMYWGNVLTDSLASTHNGMDLDVVSLGENLTAAEIRIPWVWVGDAGGVGAMPAEGRRVGLSGGYNDVDSGQASSMLTRLRWKEKDPYNTCVDLNPPHDVCDSWGDIETGPPLGEPSAIRPSPSHRHAAAATLPGLRDPSARYFALTGKSVSPPLHGHGSSSGVLVQLCGSGSSRTVAKHVSLNQ